LARAVRYLVVYPQRQTSENTVPLYVKSDRIEGCYYIVCLNDNEARKDANDQEVITTSTARK
jgi:hypothetical protein